MPTYESEKDRQNEKAVMIEVLALLKDYQAQKTKNFDHLDFAIIKRGAHFLNERIKAFAEIKICNYRKEKLPFFYVCTEKVNAAMRFYRLHCTRSFLIVKFIEGIFFIPFDAIEKNGLFHFGNPGRPENQKDINCRVDTSKMRPINEIRNFFR